MQTCVKLWEVREREERDRPRTCVSQGTPPWSEGGESGGGDGGSLGFLPSLCLKEQITPAFWVGLCPLGTVSGILENLKTIFLSSN